jgi:hypothetical protein
VTDELSGEQMILLVESDPILSACAAWRARWIEARAAAYAFAKAMGSSSWTAGWYGELVALAPVDPVPAGWTVTKPRRQRDWRRMMPAKGPAGAAARAAIEALPKPPQQGDIAKLIGHPCNVAWEMPDGSARGSGAMGRSIHPVQITFATRDSPMVIFCPDPAPRLARLRRDYPGCVITSGEWTPPPGVVQISQARADFIAAEARLRAETLGVTAGAGVAA